MQKLTFFNRKKKNKVVLSNWCKQIFINNLPRNKYINRYLTYVVILGQGLALNASCAPAIITCSSYIHISVTLQTKLKKKSEWVGQNSWHSYHRHSCVVARYFFLNLKVGRFLCCMHCFMLNKVFHRKLLLNYIIM